METSSHIEETIQVERGHLVGEEAHVLIISLFGRSREDTS